MAYETTEVEVSRSQAAIRDLLAGYGAEQYGFREGQDAQGRFALVEFIHHNHGIRMAVRLKEPDWSELEKKVRRARTRTRADIMGGAWDQEAKRIWRVMFHTLKARMVAVEEGLETFEQAFLPYIVEPTTGKTLWETLEPAFSGGAMEIGGGGLRALEART